MHAKMLTNIIKKVKRCLFREHEGKKPLDIIDFLRLGYFDRILFWQNAILIG